MELHMHSHQFESRAPDWVAAAVAGFVAGAVLMVLELLWSVNRMGASPWTVSHLIAGIVMGPDVARGSDFDVAVVAVALLTHYVLGMAFGVLLACIIAPFHLDSSMAMVLLVGALFGGLLYLFNFHGMVRYFPWFDDLRGTVTLLVHLIFGMVAAGMYRQLERPAYR